MYLALTRDLNLDDLYALEDIDNVDRSWRDAQQANAELSHG